MKNKILLILLILFGNNKIKSIIIENKTNQEYNIDISGGYITKGQEPIETIKLAPNESVSINKYISKLFYEGIDRQLLLLNLLPIYINAYKSENIGSYTDFAYIDIPAKEYYLIPESRYFILPEENGGTKINDENKQFLETIHNQLNYEKLNEEEKAIADRIILMLEGLNISEWEKVD